MLLLLAGCQSSAVNPTAAVPKTTSAPSVMIEPEGFIQRVHDPVIAKENGKYYVFHTGSLIPFLCSPDKKTWEFCGRVFEKNPDWTREINRDLVDIWAPDISFFNKQWHLYYAVSSFGSQNSAIGLATNANARPQKPRLRLGGSGHCAALEPGGQMECH